MRLRGYVGIGFVCFFYWILDSIWSKLSFEYNLKKMIFSEQTSFLDTFLLKVSPYQMVSRLMVVSLFAILGIIVIEFMIKRQAAKKELKESEEKYRIIVENQTDLIVTVDIEGRFLFVSPSYCKMFGKEEADLIGRNFMPLVHEEDRETTARGMEKLFNPPFSEYLEHRAMTKGGWKWMGWMGTAVLDDNGKVKEIIGVGRDISANKQAEKEKIEAQRIAAEHENYALVGRIAGKIAHDFNNILGVIMGNSELALLDCPHPPTRKTLELVFEQTMRGRNLTKNLVAFAQDQEPKQEFILLDEKMDLVLNLLKKDLDGIKVIRQYGHGMPELLADSGMMEHAIVNLIQNSIHAVSLTEQAQITVRTYYQDAHIYFEIEDNGCGIPSEYLDKIYEPFFTLKGKKDKSGLYKSGIKGTGYGMSNVKKYVDLHKGSILIHSQMKKGTKVVIRLPVVKKESTNEEIKKVKKESVSSGKYILLVEDEPAIADVQYRILTHDPCHHRVDIASNGRVAIDLFNRNKYDFVSLDYILPGELNGMDVYHLIRKTNETIPILFISGNIEFIESIVDLKQKDPYIDHLSKPCKKADYVNGVNNLFGNLPN